MKNLLKNKKGVFGLTAVQGFFAIILGIALLAYVIVIIMGTLSTTTILPSTAVTVTNESGFINNTGYTLADSLLSLPGYASQTIVTVYNTTDGYVINSGNWTLTGGTLTNSTSKVWTGVSIVYTYVKDSTYKIGTDGILANTSTGITGFFSAINPVYAILAILVIILILVVLVRVVQGGGASKPSGQVQL